MAVGRIPPIIITIIITCINITSYHHNNNHHPFVLVINVVSARIASGDVVTFLFERLTSFTASAGRCPGNTQRLVLLRFCMVGGRIRHRFPSAPVRAVAQTELLPGLILRISIRRYFPCHIVVKQVLAIQRSTTSKYPYYSVCGVVDLDLIGPESR